VAGWCHRRRSTLLRGGSRDAWLVPCRGGSGIEGQHDDFGLMLSSDDGVFRSECAPLEIIMMLLCCGLRSEELPVELRAVWVEFGS
jgi:hypothetical protein